MSQVASLSAAAIRRSYIDEATKAALLGLNPGTSFGLPMSTAASFVPSALADSAAVVLVPAVEGKVIIPMMVIAGTRSKLDADISAALGWPNPDPDNPTEHDEPWLGAASTLWFANDTGSLVLLPNVGARPVARLWPECVLSRPFALKTDTPPAPPADPEAPEPVLTIVTFYTVF